MFDLLIHCTDHCFAGQSPRLDDFWEKKLPADLATNDGLGFDGLGGWITATDGLDRIFFGEFPHLQTYPPSQLLHVPKTTPWVVCKECHFHRHRYHPISIIHWLTQSSNPNLWWWKTDSLAATNQVHLLGGFVHPSNQHLQPLRGRRNLARRRTSWSSVKKSTASLWRAPLMRLASSKERGLQAPKNAGHFLGHGTIWHWPIPTWFEAGLRILRAKLHKITVGYCAVYGVKTSKYIQLS